MLNTGMILGERYEIISKIGTGGMADVYKAKDLKLNRNVAAKILKPEFREDTTFIKKFRSEAQAAAGLTHPNIVNVFDVGEDDGMHYIVMELIEGITLKEYISKKGKLSVKEATSIAIQVSMGLEAAHSHGIIHRDVKPQNIMINLDGKVKVTDFGIARAASSNTISSNVMGSVHYSSPEQVRGGYSDEKSDIYSLGITMYEMVTGKVPFEGDTTVAIAIKHLQEEMVPANDHEPDLPYSLGQVINKCTQKSVDRRYQKMEEVIADLKHSLVDPEGDFVKINPVDDSARTLVINDRDLTKIKNNAGKVVISRVSVLDEDDEEDDKRKYDDEDDEDYRSSKRDRKNDREKNGGKTGLKVVGFLAAAAVIAGVVYLAGNRMGWFEQNDPTVSIPTQEEGTVQDSSQSEVMFEVPDLVGLNAEEIVQAMQDIPLSAQKAGEEYSSSPEGTIFEQDPKAGSLVPENSTVYYKVSKGTEEFEMPDYIMQLYEPAVEDLLQKGITVIVHKQYDDYAEEDFVLDTTPEAGEMIKPGDTVTLAVSDNDVLYEDIPDETFTPENQASGNTVSETAEQNDTESEDVQASESEDENSEQTEENDSQQEDQDVQNNGTVWVCTQKLDTPGADYKGGPLRLELVQEVNGEIQATTIVEGTILQFPYQLNIVGAPGVSEGELHISEQVDGEYIELGYYPIVFKEQ